MSEEHKTSPYRRHSNDLEAGISEFEEEDDSGPFDILRSKSAYVDRLKQWRQAALVLNASRRFRYTLDLKKEEEKKQVITKIRTHAQVIRAAYLFQAAAKKDVSASPKLPITAVPSGDHGSTPEQLASMTRDHDFSALQNYGGVNGLADTLKTSLDKGINGNEADILERKDVYGSNTYPKKKGRSFWSFLLDACRDTTLIILMVAAAASLALDIKGIQTGITEGWYVGGSIALAVIIVKSVTAFSDYKQSLQFQTLSEEKQIIHLEVTRGGRRVMISIFDIVVGDVLPLKIGDQVPADGVLINGHSLQIDESSMTGESKIVQKDQKAPFLMSGCKVADGYGIMLVTSVGINTEWGLLMSSILDDNGEETPLQVRLNGVATFIGIVGLTVAVAVLVVLLARYFTGHSKEDEGKQEYFPGKTKASDAVDGAIKIFTVAVTIVVVAVQWFEERRERSLQAMIWNLTAIEAIELKFKSDKKEITANKDLRDAFDLYDLDKNGLISATELHGVLNTLGEKCSFKDCRMMVSFFDVDGDGNVDFEEFKKMMNKVLCQDSSGTGTEDIPKISSHRVGYLSIPGPLRSRVIAFINFLLIGPELLSAQSSGSTEKGPTGMYVFTTSKTDKRSWFKGTTVVDWTYIIMFAGIMLTVWCFYKNRGSLIAYCIYVAAFLITEFDKLIGNIKNLIEKLKKNKIEYLGSVFQLSNIALSSPFLGGTRKWKASMVAGISVFAIICYCGKISVELKRAEVTAKIFYPETRNNKEVLFFTGRHVLEFFIPLSYCLLACVYLTELDTKNHQMENGWKNVAFGIQVFIHVIGGLLAFMNARNPNYFRHGDQNQMIPMQPIHTIPRKGNEIILKDKLVVAEEVSKEVRDVADVSAPETILVIAEELMSEGC